VAAGNDRKNACSYSPASEASAITVAASTDKDRLASFTNYGKCVDIVAPGENILSTYPSNGYTYMSGTSMASPIVAGVWSTHPEWESEDLLKAAKNGLIVGRLPNATPNKFVFNDPTKPPIVFQ
jgi:subtilisin family serine protease